MVRRLLAIAALIVHDLSGKPLQRGLSLIEDVS
jgi:hypothetical protein